MEFVRPATAVDAINTYFLLALNFKEKI